ncbi:folliculin-interacting protein N-terminus-domain-containing protein [Microdochium trichocladiopsis]|uniref:Folliculin-interacting protein N-terminus-domain-containing protein n=1 Tax=Microdochium trichocladiopsis TaxID=1682393 RepID=A0A9P8Y6X8_9PEZI|nr:folliculin-interacting protein N-terminus-domain-containing protein [Microdochium trichocladiopsis]KAH7031421.1 folliculin-interacting protein N-terminus-domain-containing protein [Microdochium trichocladiopsis]
MLGKLFNLTAGAPNSMQGAPGQTPSSPSPESVQEDVHTRSLLFPEAETLFGRTDQLFPLPSASAVPLAALANAFDYDGDLDLDARDVRVIIMQDSLGSVHPSLLFDSHPCQHAEATERSSQAAPVTTPSHRNPSLDLRRGPVPQQQRKGSLGQSSRPLVIQPGSPQPRQGAFDRRGSIQSRSQSYVETAAQRSAREYREELASFSSCIFANSEVLSYKGTSTKVHIVPSEQRAADVASTYFGDGRGSLGRSSMRSSRLAQSFTSDTKIPFSPGSGSAKVSDRRKILITRLFPVNLPLDDADSPTGQMGRVSEDMGGFPFPYSPDENKAKRKKLQPKQKRTPMYAVALVLQIPSNPISMRDSAPRSSFRGPGSYGDHAEQLSASYGSARRSGWTMVGIGSGNESTDYIHNLEMDDRMDSITQHWDVIMRALTHLQSTVATALFPMLKQADLATADPLPPNIAAAHLARSGSLSGRRGSDASQMKPPKTNAKLITLQPNCLMQDHHVGVEVDDARVRIVSGLRATRVVTGQNRWGPWRDEARWVSKWAGGKEHGFFFFKLLTGFLATHTDWLQALGPAWYRRRHYQQQKNRTEEDTSLSSRTIIVADDKMAARRLIFLLSAFLPANQQLPTVRAHRPGTSASFANYGQSPPASYIIPILKEESLRRKINRRPGIKGASHHRSFSIQSQTTNRSVTGIPAQLAHLSMDGRHGRRPSDAASIRAGKLTGITAEQSTRKSSAATTNTVMPEDAVPHFTTLQKTESHHSERPGSNSSVAANDLKRTLTRGDSSRASHGSNGSRSQSSRWGSVISGLWSTRRRDSTASTSQTFDVNSIGEALEATAHGSPSKGNKLAEMVKEVQGLDTSAPLRHTSSRIPDDELLQTPTSPRKSDIGPFNEPLEPRPRIPDPSGAFESPVKTSINHDDGVIDVDIQFPDYLTSFETAVSSPSSSGYLSTPGLGSGLDSFEHFSRVAIDGDVPQNCAGWLREFHPDFMLQAIPPQADLIEKVKESLRSEPTPIIYANTLSVEWPAEQWVDVSSALVADTTNFTIKRIRFRRLVKPKVIMDRGSGSAGFLTAAASVMTPALSPYEKPIKEHFEVEELFTWDEDLIDAVEKVIAHGLDSSKQGSTTSSRSASKRRDRRDSEISVLDQNENNASSQLGYSEVPRAECKTVVLSALSGLVQSIVDRRERDAHNTEDTSELYRSVRERESVLRLAVKSWLETVESGDGAP